MGGEGAPPSLEGDVPEDCPLLVDPVLLFLKVDTMVAGEQVVEGGTAGLEVTVTEGLAKTLATAAAGAGRAVMTTSPFLASSELNWSELA